jgi:hypothetical protein
VILDRCEEAARTTGFAAGLAEVLTNVDVADAAFGAVVAIPTTTAGTGTVPNPLAEAEGISFMRVKPGRDARAAATVAGRLARARIGLSAAALAAAAQRLRHRTAGGEPIVRKQLVIGSIAEASLELNILRHQAALVSRSLEPAAAGHLHKGIDDVAWQIAMLFGASGYVTGGPLAEKHGTALYVSTLVAHSWVARTEVHVWN